MMDWDAPLRLRLDGEALVSNWQWLRGRGGGAACGAAVKADGYGLGAQEVTRKLAGTGCVDLFVATWGEARALMPALPEGCTLSVLHGVREEDMSLARALADRARPVLNSATQVSRWKAAGGGVCDVMVDTGMNRLGLSLDEAMSGLLDGLEIDTLMSHLACADEEHHLNGLQLMLFGEAKKSIAARRYSLANSAGICLGTDYAFDLTRPGIALYGGTPRGECEGHIRPVVVPQAQILQRRRIPGGEAVGYGATHVVDSTVEAATINIGYADGYGRVFSGMGAALHEGENLPVLGRVSMDLVVIDVTHRPDLAEGDWVDIDYDLSFTSIITGLSQYELLTNLGSRFDRIWQ